MEEIQKTFEKIQGIVNHDFNILPCRIQTHYRLYRVKYHYMIYMEERRLDVHQNHEHAVVFLLLF